MVAETYPINDSCETDARTKSSKHEGQADKLTKFVDPNGVFDAEESDQDDAEGQKNDKSKAHDGVMECGEEGEFREVLEDGQVGCWLACSSLVKLGSIGRLGRELKASLYIVISLRSSKSINFHAPGAASKVDSGFGEAVKIPYINTFYINPAESQRSESLTVSIIGVDGREQGKL